MVTVAYFLPGRDKDLSANPHIMTPKESKISKQAAASATGDIKFTIPVTLEIIRRPGNATSYSATIPVHTIGLLTIYGIKKYKDKINSKNYLINGIFNNLALLQSCGCQIK